MATTFRRLSSKRRFLPVMTNGSSEETVGESTAVEVFSGMARQKEKVARYLLSLVPLNWLSRKRPVKPKHALLRSNVPRDSWVKAGRKSRLASARLMFCRGFAFCPSVSKSHNHHSFCLVMPKKTFFWVEQRGPTTHRFFDRSTNRKRPHDFWSCGRFRWSSFVVRLSESAVRRCYAG